MIPNKIPSNEVEVSLNFLAEVRDKRSLLLSEEDRLSDEFNEKTIKEFFESALMREHSSRRSIAFTKPYTKTHNDKMDVLMTRPQDVLGMGYIISVNDREVKFRFKVPDTDLYNGLKNGGILLSLDGIVVDGGKILNARISYRYNPDKPIEEQNLVLKKGE